jgi:hypothetical protein
MHFVSLEHALPHAPQFAGSDWALTHAPPHRLAPPGHTQAERVHADPCGQATPHPPQFVASLVRSTHAPAQAVVPAGQASWQAPPAHT